MRVEPSRALLAPNVPSGLPHYPYCMLRTYLCGHPPEVIEVAKHHSRTVHRLLNMIPKNLDGNILTFSLARCRRCVEVLRPNQLPNDVVKSQGRAPTETRFKEAHGVNGFRDVLMRYRISSKDMHHVVLMDGYGYHDGVPEWLNRKDDRVFKSRLECDVEKYQYTRSYQRALRIREGEEIPGFTQEIWDKRQRGDVAHGSYFPSIDFEAENVIADPSYLAGATIQRGESSRHERLVETQLRRPTADELDRIRKERRKVHVYTNTDVWRQRTLEEGYDLGEYHERRAHPNREIHQQRGGEYRRVVEGLSDILGPDLQIKGSNWNITKISQWNDAATGIPDGYETCEPANDVAIGVDDSISVITGQKRAQRESADSVQSHMSKQSKRTSESVSSRKNLRLSEEVLESGQIPESYTSDTWAKGRVQEPGESERLKTESLKCDERMERLGHLRAIPRSFSIRPLEVKRSESLPSKASKVIEAEQEKAKKWKLDERMTSLGQMGAATRPPRNSKETRRSDGMQSKASRSSAESRSRLKRRNTMANAFNAFRWKTKDKGTGVANIEDGEERST